MLTRRSRIQEKRSARSGLFLIIASICLIGLMVIFGIPLLIRLTNFVTDFNKNNTSILQEDSTPPSPPQLNLKEGSVKIESLTVSGQAEEGSTLQVFVNGEQIKESLVGDTSSFTFDITLSKGDNEVWARAVDTAGNQSSDSSHFKLNYDLDPPILEIFKPTDKQTFDDKSITVEGETDKASRLTINDRVAIVSNDGKFSLKLILSPGENQIKIIATDLAANQTEKTVTVTYSE